jgi:hypothetical protein
MPEVLQIFTILRRLYSPDVIPWALLLIESNVQRIRDRYKFKLLTQEVGVNGVVARLSGATGEFSTTSGLQVIQQLIVEPTVLHLQISGGSDVADRFANDLVESLSEITNTRIFAEAPEITRTYQTIAIAKLRLPVGLLFSDGLRTYLNEDVKPKLMLPEGEPEIRLQSLSWAVRYKMESTDFHYLPKLITIEPRQGSRPSDMIYYTVSPSDSKTHLELLEKLESKFHQ